MAKKLNIAAIASELSEGSAFFPGIRSLLTPLLRQSLFSNRLSRHPVPLVLPVPPYPQKRHMKQRHLFDIYHDQYQSLQEFALEERKQSGVGRMSAFVREGIDLIIERKRKELLK
jgi:hypothetical protein